MYELYTKIITDLNFLNYITYGVDIARGINTVCKCIWRNIDGRRNQTPSFFITTL